MQFFFAVLAGCPASDTYWPDKLPRALSLAQYLFTTAKLGRFTGKAWRRLAKAGEAPAGEAPAGEAPTKRRRSAGEAWRSASEGKGKAKAPAKADARQGKGGAEAR